METTSLHEADNYVSHAQLGSGAVCVWSQPAFHCMPSATWNAELLVWCTGDRWCAWSDNYVKLLIQVWFRLQMYIIICSSLCPNQSSSGAVWKSRRLSWAPIPSKPTVSVDVKQHFNCAQPELSQAQLSPGHSVNGSKFSMPQIAQFWVPCLDSAIYIYICHLFITLPSAVKLLCFQGDAAARESHLRTGLIASHAYSVTDLKKVHLHPNSKRWFITSQVSSNHFRWWGWTEW